MITGWEILAAVVAVALAVLAARPYVPAWAAYALAIGLALERFVHLLSHGANPKSIVAVAVYVSLAAFVWWNRLRRRKEE